MISLDKPPNKEAESPLTAIVAHAVQQALAANRAVDAETHATHHQFVDDLIERSRRKREMWDKVQAQVVGWGVVTILGAIGYAVSEWANSIIKSWLSKP